jgi:hypothetical protein
MNINTERIEKQISTSGDQDIYKFDGDNNIIYTLINGKETHYLYNKFKKPITIISDNMIVKNTYNKKGILIKSFHEDLEGYSITKYDKYNMKIHIISKSHSGNYFECKWKRINDIYYIIYLNNEIIEFSKSYNKYGMEVYYEDNTGLIINTSYREDN